jgi:hypothetical protein
MKVRRYPLRTAEHVLEESSERYFQQHLPKNWTMERPSKDYGVDLRVDIFEGEKATSLELLIQLKASQRGVPKDYETVRLYTSAYNHLWDKLQVVMIVKYVAEEREAYWILLRDVPEPKQQQESFTVRIPKTQSLSAIDWDFIKTLVQNVSAGKLTMRRRNRTAPAPTSM